MNIARIRKINAIICSVAVLFFLAHGIMGTIMAVHPFEAKFAFMAWGGAILLLVHMCLAVFITMNKKNDPTPPSKGKHALQWITGTAILVLALFHMDFIGSAGSGVSFIELPNFASLGVMIGLMVALIAHIIINLNSMFADLGMTGPEKAESARKHALYMGILVCVVFVVLAVLLSMQLA